MSKCTQRRSQPKIVNQLYLSDERPIDTLYGNLQGLKKNPIKQLEKLDFQRLPGDRLATYRNLLNTPLLSAQKLTSPFVPTLSEKSEALKLLPTFMLV
ncbi:MAG: hypothetical protein KY448_00445 [Cyanobacteria bacterium 0813]|nr:hypothetical protein [Cyanobacteria bacterium 0813]